MLVIPLPGENECRILEESTLPKSPKLFRPVSEQECGFNTESSPYSGGKAKFYRHDAVESTKKLEVEVKY